MSKLLPEESNVVLSVDQILATTLNVFGAIVIKLPTAFPLELTVIGVNKDYVTVQYSLLVLKGTLDIPTRTWMHDTFLAAKYLMQFIKTEIMYADDDPLMVNHNKSEYITFLICSTVNKIDFPAFDFRDKGNKITISYNGTVIGVYNKDVRYKTVLEDLVSIVPPPFLVNVESHTKTFMSVHTDHLSNIQWPGNHDEFLDSKKYFNGDGNNFNEQFDIPLWLYESIKTIGGFKSIEIKKPQSGWTIRCTAIMPEDYKVIVTFLMSLNALNRKALAAYKFDINHPVIVTPKEAVTAAQRLFDILNLLKFQHSGDIEYLLFVKDSFVCLNRPIVSVKPVIKL